MTYAETQPGQRPRDCISHIAFLLEKMGNNHLVSTTVSMPLPVCDYGPAETSLSHWPLQLGWCRVSTDNNYPYANTHSHHVHPDLRKAPVVSTL